MNCTSSSGACKQHMLLKYVTILEMDIIIFYYFPIEAMAEHAVVLTIKGMILYSQK
jgi:hypothetical protein